VTAALIAVAAVVLIVVLVLFAAVQRRLERNPDCLRIERVRPLIEDEVRGRRLDGRLADGRPAR
jgi:hypothetical protein